jgi:hypothetical protein
VGADGTAQTYQAEVTTFGARQFKRGAATVSASGSVHGERNGTPVDQRTELVDQSITITRR